MPAKADSYATMARGNNDGLFNSPAFGLGFLGPVNVQTDRNQKEEGY